MNNVNSDGNANNNTNVNNTRGVRPANFLITTIKIIHNTKSAIRYYTFEPMLIRGNKCIPWIYPKHLYITNLLC